MGNVGLESRGSFPFEMHPPMSCSFDRGTPRAPALLLIGLLAAACGDTQPGSGPSNGAQTTAGAQAERGKRSPTIVLISLDTLRPERLGVYGNSPEVSPVLDAFAREAVVFDDALSVAPWTLPAHMTMLTGLDPIAHGVRWAANRLSSKVETVAETLSAAGYATAAFADGGFVGTGWGLEDGFTVFDSKHRDGQGRTGFARYLDDASRWLRASEGKPVFLFLHSFDVHAPYDECDPAVLSRFRARATPDGELDHELYKGSHTAIAREMRMSEYQRISEVLNDYDAGVHEADLAVGQVFRTLRELGRWDDALVIVTSDHGESFYDQRLWIGHGINLTDDEIAVPLLVKFPGNEGAGSRNSTLVDTVDLAPTMLDAARAPIPSVMKGSSLRELVRGGKRSRSYAFGHTANSERYFLVRGDLKYITGTTLNPFQIIRPHLDPRNPPVVDDLLPGGEYVRKLADGGERVTRYSEAADVLGFADVVALDARLYDRRSDPHELIDLSDARSEDARRMGEALLRVEQESARIAAQLADASAPRTMTVHEQKALAELGYLASDVGSDGDDGPVANHKRVESPRPNMTELFATDRIVHRIRIARRAGRELSDQLREELLECIEPITAWAEQNTGHHYRAHWRLREIEQMCADAGEPVNLAAPLRRISAAVAKTLNRREAAFDPDVKQKLQEELEERRRQRRERRQLEREQQRNETKGDG